MKLTVVPAYATPVFRNHGNDSPNKMSKTLLPRELETAISPIPRAAKDGEKRKFAML